MKTLFKLGLFSLLVLFCGCTDYLNKPLAEPMSVEELKGAIKKDSTFLDFYEKIQRFRKDFFSEDLNQVKYGDLTYRRLYDYIKKTDDSTFTKPLYKKAESEWESKYSIYVSKVDSVAEYWKKYEEEHSLQSFLKIEFRKLDKEYYTYNHDIKNVLLGFYLTPLKGKVDQVKFSYEVKSKLESNVSSYWNDDRGNCILTSPFSSPVIKYWEAPYSLEQKLKYKSTDDFIRDYDVIVKITAIRFEGENLSEETMLTPNSVKEYLNYPSSYSEGQLIKTCIYNNYKTIDELYDVKLQEALKSFDKLCYEFVECIQQKY